MLAIGGVFFSHQIYASKSIFTKKNTNFFPFQRKIIATNHLKIDSVLGGWRNSFVQYVRSAINSFRSICENGVIAKNICSPCCCLHYSKVLDTLASKKIKNLCNYASITYRTKCNYANLAYWTNAFVHTILPEHSRNVISSTTVKFEMKIKFSRWIMFIAYRTSFYTFWKIPFFCTLRCSLLTICHNFI